MRGLYVIHLKFYGEMNLEVPANLSFSSSMVEQLSCGTSVGQDVAVPQGDAILETCCSLRVEYLRQSCSK